MLLVRWWAGRFAHLPAPLERWEETVGLALGQGGVPGELPEAESPVIFPFPSGHQKEKVEGTRGGRPGPSGGMAASVNLNFIRSH